MAGYHNYSKSNNALKAESEGLFPLSKAKKIVADNTGISQKLASMALKYWHDGEYHHTSKYFNSTSYYDTVFAITAIKFGQSLEITIDVAFFEQIYRYTSCNIDELTDEIDIEEFIQDVRELRNKYIKQGEQYAQDLLKEESDEQWMQKWIKQQSQYHRHTLMGIHWDAAYKKILEHNT